MAREDVVRTIEARVHGRYVIRVPDGPGPWPTLIGFHGYGEDAPSHLDALQRIPGIDTWLVVAVQALHPFYTRTDRIVASWMTRLDRELAIADNVAYVSGVVDAVRREYGTSGPPAFAGFSQGGAMAYRAAAHLGGAGAIVLAADVPPDVAGHHVLPRVLLGRGTADIWYTEQKMSADLARLRDLAVSAETCVFDGGHEWADAFLTAAGEFLQRLRGKTGARRLD